MHAGPTPPRWLASVSWRPRSRTARSPRSSIRRDSDPGTGQPFTKNMINRIRYKYAISSCCPEGLPACAEGYRADGRCLSRVAAELLQVNVSTINAWCHSGVLDGIQADAPRPLVDQVDAGDHRPLAQAHASHLDAGIRPHERDRAQGRAGPPSPNPQPRCKEVQYE